MRPRNEQGGELVVTNSGHVKIHLKDNPHRVEVFFKKKNAPPPCDPHHGHHHDRLEWRIQRSHHGHHGHHYAFELHINWHVHEIREIFYIVYY